MTFHSSGLLVPLSHDDSDFVSEVAETYEDMLCSASSRIGRGKQLWEQFEAAVEAYAAGQVVDRAVLEKVNELAVARELTLDATITGTVEYEPDILPSGRKIDFVIDRGKDRVYVEVKTVRPKPGDEEANWKAYVARRQFHPENVHFIVGGTIGGTLYANSFASRTKFLQYSLDFETRLDEAKALTSGPGVLVFCGTGFQWSVDELEDFADFYHDGRHRSDDAFGPMEAHHIKQNNVVLSRTIDHFAFLKRPAYVAKRTEFRFPVRGPRFIAPRLGTAKR